MGNWSMFTWCFCFAVTLVILIVELAGIRPRFPLSWHNFPSTCTCYAALFCLSSSVIYPTTYVQFVGHGGSRDHAIAATTFSSIACLAYAAKVALTLVACIIFAFISDPGLYQREPAPEWCVAICFILAAVTILMNLWECTNLLPIPFPTFLSGLAFLSVLFYASALVLWPLYQFSEKYHGQPRRSMDAACAYRHPHNVCNWDRRLAVAILTGINLSVRSGTLCPAGVCQGLRFTRGSLPQPCFQNLHFMA